MTLAVMEKTRDRLRKTGEGRALLSLLDDYETPTKMASVLGFNAQSIRQWILRGKVSKRAAIELELLTGREREEFRPDLDEKAWNSKPCGAPQGHVPVATTSDAKLLVELADQFGSVQSLCESAMCTAGDYHTWKSRGRIPAIKLPTFLALRK